VRECLCAGGWTARAAQAEREAPRYVLSMRENLEFVLEQMRRVEQQKPSPAVLELLNRNARRPKKVRCLRPSRPLQQRQCIETNLCI
jgi:hypothetical protein